MSKPKPVVKILYLPNLWHGLTAPQRRVLTDANAWDHRERAPDEVLLMPGKDRRSARVLVKLGLLRAHAPNRFTRTAKGEAVVSWWGADWRAAA